MNGVPDRYDAIPLICQCFRTLATGKARRTRTIFFDIVKGKKVTPPASLPTNKTVDEIPFLPGFKEKYLSRASQAEDPHTRCKPSGGSRFWHTPYGIEIVDLPETNEVIFLHVGAPHSWRIAYTDGREHPKDLKPSWYGHTTGKWEGDTLVMETVGFNERFWLTREGVPHTSSCISQNVSRARTTTNCVTRPRWTIRARTPQPWSGGWNLRWSEGNEPFDYLCQENNRDPARMVGAAVGGNPEAQELTMSAVNAARSAAAERGSYC